MNNSLYNSQITTLYQNLTTEIHEQGTNNRLWSIKDDKYILALANQMNQDWKMMSRLLKDPRKTPYVIKERYTKLISFYNQNKKQFSYLEDLIIVKAVNLTKIKKWSMISEDFLPFRTPIQIKNRYYHYIRKRGIEDILIKEQKALEASSKTKIEDLIFDNISKEVSKYAITTNQRTLDDNRRAFKSLKNELQQINNIVSEISCNMNQILSIIE